MAQVDRQLFILPSEAPGVLFLVLLPPRFKTGIENFKLGPVLPFHRCNKTPEGSNLRQEVLALAQLSEV